MGISIDTTDDGGIMVCIESDEAGSGPPGELTIVISDDGGFKFVAEAEDYEGYCRRCITGVLKHWRRGEVSD